MAVKVLTATFDREPAWEMYCGTHRLVFTVNLTMEILMRDRTTKKAVATFVPGFRCDGLSVPFVFRWFLKGWDESNPLYNMAGALHDWLYATKGNGGMFTREECDDIFRGILREAGKSRCKAGVADKAVEWFAGGKNHWGNDDYAVGSLVWLTMRNA